MSRPARSEREAIRRQMNSMGMMGRGGDWMGYLVLKEPQVAAKVYKMEADDSLRDGFPDDAQRFMDEAIKLWPEVVSWTGRKEKDVHHRN